MVATYNFGSVYIFSSSDRCHETKTTDGACFIHEGYITML